jgi:hypothetical protein
MALLGFICSSDDLYPHGLMFLSLRTFLTIIATAFLA